MRKVQCEECGKNYDYDEDDFCPRCGAYNAPQRNSSAGRMDGLNERNHADSFVHSELHTEEKVRRRAGLEQPVRQIQKQPAPKRPKPEKKEGKSGTAAAVAVVLVILQLLLKMCAA